MVKKVLRKARKGARVIVVLGNHDEFARKCVRHNFGGVEVGDDFEIVVWSHCTSRVSSIPEGAAEPDAARGPAKTARNRQAAGLAHLSWSDGAA